MLIAPSSYSLSLPLFQLELPFSTMFSSLLFLLLLHIPPHLTAAICATTVSSKSHDKCLTLPTQGASLGWTYHSHNSTVDLSFSGSFLSPSGWVAWGINPDSPSMTGAHALAAFPDPSSGALVLLSFVLDASVKLQQTPIQSRPFGPQLLSSSASVLQSVRAGAAVQISATLRLSPNRTRLHLVWNRGVYVQGYSPAIHPTDAADLASRATVDIAGSAEPETPPPDRLRVAHAALNVASWGLLIPAGAAVARYLRPAGGPAWFYVHAVMQVLGLAAGAAGFAIGMVMGARSPGVEYGLHRGLGVAVVVGGGLQAAALVMRPRTTNKYRKYWKSYHHLVGYGSVVVGVVNIFQGFEVMGLGRSWWKLIYCMGLATMVGVCVALEVNSWVVFCRRMADEEEEKVAAAQGVENRPHNIVWEEASNSKGKV